MTADIAPDDVEPKRRRIGRPPAAAAGVGRETLIRAACELLGRLPVEQVTMTEVARAARVDPSLIRYYFKTRTSMLVAAVEKLTENFGEFEAEYLKGADGPEDHLFARIAALSRLEVTYPFFHRVMVNEVVHSDTPEARRLMERLMWRGVRAYEAIMADGERAGTMRRVDSGMLFIAITALCNFFNPSKPMLSLVDRGAQSNEQLSQDYYRFICDLLMNGLRARDASGANGADGGSRIPDLVPGGRR